MKAILPLFCAALILAPVGAEAASGVSGAGVLKVAAEFQRWGNKHRGDGDNDGNNGNGDNNGGHRRDGGDNGGQWGGNRGQQRDNRINRAMDIARSRGTVLDAWPMGGSMFGVRVATDHGRVDLTVDTDSGRIVGEH